MLEELKSFLTLLMVLETIKTRDFKYTIIVYLIRAITFVLPFYSLKILGERLELEYFNELISTLSLSMLSYAVVNFGQDVALVSRVNRGENESSVLSDLWAVRLVFYLLLSLLIYFSSSEFRLYLIIKTFFLSISLKFISNFKGKIIEVSILDSLYIVSFFAVCFYSRTVENVLISDLIITGIQTTYFLCIHGLKYFRLHTRIHNPGLIINFGVSRVFLDSYRFILIWLVANRYPYLSLEYAQQERLVYPIMALSGIFAQIVFYRSGLSDINKLYNLVLKYYALTLIVLTVVVWNVNFFLLTSVWIGLVGGMSVLIGLPMFERMQKQRANNTISLLAHTIALIVILISTPRDSVLFFLAMYLTLFGRIVLIIQNRIVSWIK